MRNDNATGERIRRLRRERGLTLKDIARRSGYSYQAIASYERGTRRVGVEQAMRLSGALACTLQDILGDDSADAFAVAGSINLYNLPGMVAGAPCVAIRDPLAYAGTPTEADADAALTHQQKTSQSLEAARYMEYLASNYEAVIDLLDQCLGEGAGLIALRMLSAYSRLNAAGRERCLEMLEDLPSIPRFAGQ